MRSRITLFLFIVFLYNSATAQRVFVNAPQILEFTGGPGSCSYTLITNECGVSTAAAPYNMAVYKDTIYYTNASGSLYSFKIDVPNSCISYPAAGILNPNNLTVDPDGILYWVDSEVRRFNPHTNQLQDLGPIPSTFASAGDLLFYGNKLLLAGVPAGIYEININNPAASTLYMSTGNLLFYGFMSYPVACGNNRFFGLSPDPVGTGMYELDLVNKVVIGNSCVLPLFVYDAGSTTENGINAIIQVSDITLSQSCASQGSIHISAFMTGENITYTLDNNNSNTTGIFDNLPPGSHLISITAGNCSLDTTVILLQPAGPSINSIQKNEPSGCNESNGSITIDASSASMPVSYTLQTTGTQQSNGVFTNLPAGVYYFSIANADGCVTDTSVTLSYTTGITPVSTTINVSDPVCLNEPGGSISVLVNGTQGPYSILINNNVYANNQLITGLPEGLYSIIILNKDGCIADTASRKLILRYEPPCAIGCINAKNAFTPNSDGTNDLWKVYDSYSCLSNVTVAVFNRYGSKVYESSDYRNTWDGHYNKKQLPDGTYFAVIGYKLITGKKITVKTDVTILR